jgi:hypothetical protein
MTPENVGPHVEDNPKREQQHSVEFAMLRRANGYGASNTPTGSPVKAGIRWWRVHVLNRG